MRGGLQEEAYYLNVPCLIFRKKTERLEGIGSTAMISDLKVDNVLLFFENLSALTHNHNFDRQHPSKVIVNHIKQIL